MDLLCIIIRDIMILLLYTELIIVCSEPTPLMKISNIVGIIIWGLLFIIDLLHCKERAGV
jgi:disulfide bond formation protein DsbB